MSRLIVLWVLLSAGFVQAQEAFPTYQSAMILIVNQDALFSGTALGQDILQREQEERDALIEISRAIGERFVQEEKDLTEQRDRLSPEDFRGLADAFDDKVVKARADQEADDARLLANIEARRRAFFQSIAPVLAGILRRYNAVAIIDRRSVLLFDRNLDITSEAIELLDKAYSENPEMINLIGTENE